MIVHTLRDHLGFSVPCKLGEMKLKQPYWLWQKLTQLNTYKKNEMGLDEDLRGMIPWLTSSSRVRLCWSLSWRTAWRHRRWEEKKKKKESQQRPLTSTNCRDGALSLSINNLWDSNTKKPNAPGPTWTGPALFSSFSHFLLLMGSFCFH